MNVSLCFFGQVKNYTNKMADFKLFDRVVVVSLARRKDS